MMRSFFAAALVAGSLALATGCRAPRSAAAPGTVWSPTFDAAGAARMGQEAAAQGELGIARALRRHGLVSPGTDSAARGWVAGRYPLRASELVVVAVPMGSDAAALGTWLEVARVTSRLSPWRLFPEPTLLFAALDGTPGAGIDGLRRDALWVSDSVRAVVLFASSPGDAPAAVQRWGARLVHVAPSGDLGRDAPALFDAVRRETWGLGAPSDQPAAQRR